MRGGRKEREGRGCREGGRRERGGDVGREEGERGEEM